MVVGGSTFSLIRNKIIHNLSYKIIQEKVFSVLQEHRSLFHAEIITGWIKGLYLSLMGKNQDLWAPVRTGSRAACASGITVRKKSSATCPRWCRRAVNTDIVAMTVNKELFFSATWQTCPRRFPHFSFVKLP